MKHFGMTLHHAAHLVARRDQDGADAIVAAMVRAVEARDAYTKGHSERVTRYAVALAVAAGLPRSVCDLLLNAGPLHDVGKIGVPDSVLGKAGFLTDDEFVAIEHHPEIGDAICEPLRSLRRLRPAIRHHHERYDGRGYPDGLSGTDIPLEARVLAIADSYDAMTSDRPYRPRVTRDRALATISANAGPQWDPALVSVFCHLWRPGGDVQVEEVPIQRHRASFATLRTWHVPVAHC
ncbi:MAG: hypothetical protein NVS2B16_23260 [Chloroflexota bacterium]